MAKRARRKKDKGMGALLALLKHRPELVQTLVVDPEKVKRRLKNRAARELVGGVSAGKMLLRGLAAGEPGFPDGPAALIVCSLKTVPALPYTAIPVQPNGSIKLYCMRGTTLYCGRGW